MRKWGTPSESSGHQNLPVKNWNFAKCSWGVHAVHAVGEGEQLCASNGMEISVDPLREWDPSPYDDVKPRTRL